MNKSIESLGLKDIVISKVLIFFACSVVLSFLADIPSNLGIISNLAKLFFAFSLLMVLILPLRKALLLMMLLGLTGSDIFFDKIDRYGEIATSSAIWEFNFSFIKPSWVIFGCLFFQFLKLKKRVIPKMVSNAILWCISVPIITSFLYGGFFGPNAYTEVIIDLKLVLMLPVVLVLFLSLFRIDGNFFTLTLTIFLGALLGRHFVDFIYVIFNIGPEVSEGISRGSLDSAKGAVVFLIYFGVLLVILHKRIFFGAILASISLFLLTAYTTRMLWITFFVGFIVFLVLLSFKRTILFALMTILICFTGFWLLSVIHPDSAHMAYLRYKTISEGREYNKLILNVDYNFISRIGPVRYAQILNINESSNRRYSWLWGVGYGGYYEDNIINFPSGLQSSFPDYSFDTGKFYRAHFYPVHMYLKHGLVGLYIISCLWLIPGFNLFGFFKFSKINSSHDCTYIFSLMRCMVPFLVTSMFQLYWSGKGLFLNGIILAFCIDFMHRNKSQLVALKGLKV